MGYPNLRKYADFERAIRKVGEGNLMAYVASKGHRVNKFQRNMKIIYYTMQHGPCAASKVFHIAESYPSSILYRYGRYAEELSEIMENERKAK